MKKILSTIILLFSLLPCAFALTTYTITLNGINLNTPPGPSTWYISQSGAGGHTGVDQADAWSVSSIQWASIIPGDTMYLCGMIRSTFTVQNSGLNGYPITIRGDCPTNAGTINGANVVTGSWTSVSNNVYSIPLASSAQPCAAGTCGLVAEDDAALMPVRWDTNAATTITDMVAGQTSFSSYGMWSYDSANQLLYVLGPADDDPTGHTVEATYQGNFVVLFNMSTKSYITVQNLTIKDFSDYGMDQEGAIVGGNYVSGTGGNNTIITGCHIYNGWNWGILSGGVINMRVTGSTIDHVAWAFAGPASTADAGESVRFHNNLGGSMDNNIFVDDPSAGAMLTGGSSGVSVYKNVIHDNQGLNSDYAAGIYVDTASNNFIYDNLVYNEQVGIEISSETNPLYSAGNLIYNNVIYNSKLNGVILGGANYTYVTSQGNFVYNNTIVAGPASPSIFTFQIGTSNNDTFQNNIVYGYAGIVSYQTLQPSFTSGFFDYNTYYAGAFEQYVNPSYNILTLGQWQTAVSGESNSTKTSESATTNVFTSPSTNDFSIIAATPAVNAGTNLSNIFTTDYAGTTRPSSGAWDDGAYQNI